MLFRAVGEREAGEAWAAARERAEEGVDWARVVGVDAQRMADPGLFRVLEWGAMEVM